MVVHMVWVHMVWVMHLWTWIYCRQVIMPQYLPIIKTEAIMLADV